MKSRGGQEACEQQRETVLLGVDKKATVLAATSKGSSNSRARRWFMFTICSKRYCRLSYVVWVQLPTTSQSTQSTIVYFLDVKDTFLLRFVSFSAICSLLVLCRLVLERTNASVEGSSWPTWSVFLGIDRFHNST